MEQVPANFEEVLRLARQLSPLDKLRLIEGVIPELEAAVKTGKPKPLKSLYGALADLGPAPSAEDIDEVRREMLRNFPRDDV
jgi:hypothetical protein